MSSTSGYLPPATTGGSNCPGPMTRAALLALRTGGTLSVDCHYVITDHVQGTLAAGTTITMHAVSSTELSESVQVNTLFDNEAWHGIFDLDASSIIYLRDNRGNEVEGATQVGQFDWGNTSYSYFKVLGGSTLTVNIGNTAVKQRVTVDGASSLALTNFTGTIQDSQITEGAQVNLTGTSVLWASMEVTDGTQVFGSALTAAGGSVQRGVWRNSLVTLSGAGVPTIFDTDIEGATVTHNSAATVQWGGCKFLAGTTVTHTGTAGAQTLTRCHVQSAGRILHTSGATVTGLNCVVEQQSYWECFGTTASINATNHTCSGLNARLSATLAGSITVSQGRNEDTGATRAEVGVVTLTDYTVRGTVEIIVPATATAVLTLATGVCDRNTKIAVSGAGTLTGNRVYTLRQYQSGAGSHISQSGPGVMTLTDVEVDASNLSLQASSTGNLTATRLKLQDDASVTSTSANSLTLTDSTIRLAATVNHAAALNFSVIRSDLSDSAAVATILGALGSSQLQGVTMIRGFITKQASSTAGNMLIGNIGNGARPILVYGATINHTGTGTFVCANGCEYKDSSVVTIGGDRDVIHRHVHVLDNSTVNHTGTGGVAGTFLDDIRDTTIEKFGTLTLSASGSALNYVNTTQVESNSTLAITGTSTGQTVDRCQIIANSTMTLTDCVSQAHTGNNITSSSAFSYVNVTAAKPSSQINLRSGAILNVTNATVAGLVNQGDVASNARLNISGTAGIITRFDLTTSAIVNMPQGAHTNVAASMGGTLNLNVGNATTVYHHTNVTTTTTAANNGRGRDFFNNNIV